MKPIFNIFSNKEEKEEKIEKIIVDYREKNSLLYYELKDKNFEIEDKNLKVADYIVRDIAIERKTVSDFLSSMINKRLINQLKELQQYPKRLLIIEGLDEQELYAERNISSLHPNAIRGFLLSILLSYNVPIIFSKDYKDTAQFILLLAKRKARPASLNVNKRFLDNNERLQFILEGFPGIGPQTAKKILNKYKSLKNIANVEEEELKKLIGKKAEIFKKILNFEYKEK
jgi:Fanconi anemia group M protein